MIVINIAFNKVDCKVDDLYLDVAVIYVVRETCDNVLALIPKTVALLIPISYLK